MKTTTQNKLWDLISATVEADGFELVDLDYANEGGWIVRVFADRPNPPIIPGMGVAPGHGINLDECSLISRQLSAVLDVEDIIPHQYRLEVSSPGVQRRLRKQEDFRIFTGCSVRVKTFKPIAAMPHEDEGKTPPSPSRNLQGTLHEVQDDHIVLTHEGWAFTIPMEAIARTHLEPDMEEWMKLASQQRNQA